MRKRKGVIARSCRLAIFDMLRGRTFSRLCYEIAECVAGIYSWLVGL